MIKDGIRDNSYLEDRLFEIWETYFADVPRKNLVLIKFGKNSARQLGCIKWVSENTRVKKLYKKYKEEHSIQDDERITLITLTSYFKDVEIPEFVLDSTIAHELVHYTHGFHSPLPRIVDHPHRGRIVEKELKKRGFLDIYSQSRIWIRKNWRNYIMSH